jgi:hypothetical protein
MNSRRHAACALLLGLALLVAPAQAQFTTFPTPPVEMEVTRFDELVDLISSTIEPDTWEDVGGPGSIRPIDKWDVIVVSQTPPVHEQIETLIRVVRRARREQEAGEGMTPPKERPEEKLPASLVVESDAEVQARKRIEGVLSEKTDLDFQQTPLKEVAAALATKHNVSIVLDRLAMEEEGIVEDVPITQHVAAISLRSALRLLLHEYDMTYTIRNETLQLTTNLAAEEHLVTRVYKVRDLAIEPK